MAVVTQGIGLPTPGGAECTTVPAQRTGLSTGTGGLREGMGNPAARAEPALAPSAATTMADRRGAFRHVEAPASVAAEDLAVVAVVAAAGITNRKFLGFVRGL